ncbi:MAG: family 78 glycoside hydrolase catalytic domain [Eubacteriales bacterium]|nr:family 78 glycoside hydrolase catalytic domain [Eubacteriales bacterium]
MKLTELRVNQVTEPMGFQMSPLSFYWKVEEAGQAKRQRSARIEIMSEEGRIFDSGEDEKADSLDYRVNIKLCPRTRYTWRVTVTADNGERALAESWFETGKMEESWIGKWITPNLDASVQPVLLKRVTLKQLPERARLYICGLGVYECYINGKKAGKEYLAPGYHSYDFHLQTQTYDVTEYLKAGENILQIWLGDGWFRGRLGFDGGYTNLYGDRCYAVCELYVQEDKKWRMAAATDESWQCRPSPVVFSNIYDGEIYDARLEECLKRAEGWEKVRLEGPERCGALGDRYSLPVVKKEEFAPVECIHTPKDELVLDFGQNLTGWVEFDCHLPKGMGVRLTASEIMQDGCFYHENLRTAKTEFTYLSNGELSHARPHFTFYGFRYVKVEYLNEEGEILPNTGVQEAWRMAPKNFRAFHLRSDFDETGRIVTGSQKVNQLFSNAMWGQKDNFLDVPTDCPQRDERLGWTGDAQVFSETACYNMYMPAFYRKYLWDMRAEQSILGGSVPNVVPRLKKGMVAEHGSCPWADAGVVIPWNVYLHYGSKTLLEECYPGMKAWVDCEIKKEEALGGAHLIKDGFHFADWLALDNPQPGPFGATDPLYIASAYYYRCALSVSRAAEALDYTEDAGQYGKLAEEILEAIGEKYFDKDGLCVCRTQTGSALAIAFELIPERARKGAEAEALRKRVEENNGHLNTGFVGTTILCPALTMGGYPETATDLLLNEDFPGWLYCVNLGATTIWERWDSVLADGHISEEGMNSLNHYSYGSIAAWMYGDMCGIRPLEPGFRRACLAPHPDRRLGFAECELNTSAGKYKSSWKYNEDNTITYEIEIPFGAEAEFILGSESKTLTAGFYTFVQK